jgi:hypothetical protein
MEKSAVLLSRRRNSELLTTSIAEGSILFAHVAISRSSCQHCAFQAQCFRRK